MNALQGKSAEYFVAYAISTYGFATAIVNQIGYDIIVNLKNNIVKVEVKSTTRRIKNRNAYQFTTKQGKNPRPLNVDKNSDIIAFVIYKEKPIIFFKPTIDVKGISHSIYDIHLNENDLSKKTFFKCLEKLKLFKNGIGH